MMHFATGLVVAGLHVTFLHTEHSLRSLGGAAAALVADSPRVGFLSIPDVLPDDRARAVGDLVELLESLRTKGSVPYRSLLTSLVRAGDGSGFPPVTCVVANGTMQFPSLFELGEMPFPAGGDLDKPVCGVPGMESFLRRLDLPSHFRSCTENQNDPILQMLMEITAHSRRARAVVLNTAASMEGSALAHIVPHMRDVFAIGPLHAMSPAPAAATSLWREDDGCMTWLDGQTDRSVVYVSLGSLTIISQEQFTEFLSGLVAAEYAFLWVLRPDMVGAGQSAALREAVAAAGDSRARVVEWAPQRDVLCHRAVGCFLTHARWNSTQEAASEAVPMVCWTFFSDQQINSRFVGAVWRTGLDMKDVCDRSVVERMVREAMESAEIRASAQALARQVRQDVADGGSSAAEFERLIGFIKELNMIAGFIKGSSGSYKLNLSYSIAE